MNLAPGPGDRFDLIGSPVRILDRHLPHHFPEVPHFWAQPVDTGLQDFLRRYSECGGTHHLALVMGDEIEAVGRGSSFVNTLRSHPNTELAAMCDIREDVLRERASEADVTLVFADAEKMMDAGKVDAVIIGTPMPLHAPQSIMALERGIHVLSEVPAAVSIEECRQLTLVSKRSSAKYMMAENYCYIRQNVLVQEIVRAGLFGELYFAEGEYIHELKELNEITVWRRRWQTGINGNTYPTHSLGPCLQWFEPQRVVSVSCAGSGHHYRDPRGDLCENEDTTLTLCRLSGGGLIRLRLDMLSDRPHNLTYYSLQGTNGCYEAARGLGDVPQDMAAGKEP